MTLAPTPKLSARGVDRVVADDAQTLCLALDESSLRVQPTLLSSVVTLK